MKRRAIYYLLQNPWPLRSGMHQRCFQMVRGLADAGFAVTFASARLHTDRPWTDESRAAIKRVGADEVTIFEGPDWYAAQRDRLERGWRRVMRTLPRLEDRFFCPRSLRQWFQQLVETRDADLVFINYVWFDQLVPHGAWQKRWRVVETHDLVSVNAHMWRFAEQQIRRIESQGGAGGMLAEFELARGEFTPDPREFTIQGRYDVAIAISKAEQESMQGRGAGVRAIHIPFVMEPVLLNNRYSGPALLTTGPNPFNRQGLLYFIEALLPAVRRQSPEFQLAVTGSLANDSAAEHGVTMLGFVPDLRPIYEDAAFLLCPVFAGTGQQVKVVEAMAHGVPVVAFERAARASFIRHEENGLVARSGAELGKHAAELYRDRALCRRLGAAARDTIAAEFERHRGLPGLMKALEVNR